MFMVGLVIILLIAVTILKNSMRMRKLEKEELAKRTAKTDVTSTDEGRSE